MSNVATYTFGFNVSGGTGGTGCIGKDGSTGETGGTGSTGSTGGVGSRGESFKIDKHYEYFDGNSILDILSNMSITPGDVYIITVMHDVRANQNSPISISGDMSRHMIMYDGINWYDWGYFIGTTGGTGNTGTTGNTGAQGLPGIISSSTAPLNPVDGQHWYNTSTKLTYAWDSSRSKWLSISRITLLFGANGNLTSNNYIRPIAIVTNSAAGFNIIRNATIVSISSRKTDTNTSTISFRNNTTNLTSFSSGASRDYSNLNYNFDIAAGTILQMYSSGATISNPVIAVELAWRAS